MNSKATPSVSLLNSLSDWVSEVLTPKKISYVSAVAYLNRKRP